MWNAYYSPATLHEALDLLAQHAPRARIIAGGTDILIEMDRGVRPGVDTLIDISRLPDLGQIRLEDGRFILGALVTHNDVVAHAGLRERALPLVQACWEIGVPQIRNRATVVGNLITASPANDAISPLMTLDAEVELASARGSIRTIPLDAFYTGLRKTVMHPDELVTAVSFRALDPDDHGVFLKLGLRRAQAISVVNCTALLRLDSNGVVVDAAVSLGSVAPTVVRVPSAEAVLLGGTLSPERIAAAARAAAESQTPITDVRAPADYRREMIAVLVSRALRTLASGTQRSLLPDEPAMLWGDTPHSVLDSSAVHEHNQPIDLTINGEVRRFRSGHHKTLLHLLREEGGLTGTKEGCAEGECGACTVFMDGVAVMACMVPAPRAHRTTVVTVEGLGSTEHLHPIQSAFVEHGAVQCGYCTPGLLMSGAKLLDEKPEPTHEQIQQSISGNLCRCTGYYKIVEAFKDAARHMAQEQTS